MKWLIAVLTTLLLTAGCNTPSVPEAKQEAYQRWHATRAELIYGLAKEQFEAGDLKKAESKVSEALSLDPAYPPGRLLLAKIQIEKGDYTKAVAILDHLNREHPRSAETLYLLGAAQEKRNLLADALVSYRQSYELDQTSLAPVVAAAEVLVAQGKVSEAGTYINGFLAAPGNEPGIYEVAGRLAAMQGDHDKAADYYGKACDVDFYNREYSEALGRELFLAGRYKEAAGTLDPLTKADGYEAPGSVWSMLGDCYTVMDMLPRARQAYLRAAEADPSNSDAWCNVAATALAVGDATRAMVAARQALRIDGDNLGAVMILGYAMVREGHTAQAEALLDDAARKQPQSAELRCVQGRAHQAGGDRAEAEKCYAEALRIEPGNQVARQLLASVQAGKRSGVH
jgi:tetratricopeptide (TPR) repeat protein